MMSFRSRATRPDAAAALPAFLLAGRSPVLFNQGRAIRETAFWRSAMKRLGIPAALAFWAVLAVSVARPGGADKPPPGFESLFNGKDLDGWKATGKMDVWGAENGVIFVSGSGGGWLLTEKEYGDFELRVDYKMSKQSNSGVALRTPVKGDPAYAGMEIQLIDDLNWKGLQSWQHTGSIYNVVPAKKIANKDIGEWNSMKITVKGRRVKVENNGEVLVDADLDQYVDEHGKKHPGIMPERTKGHVGFQSHDNRVEFKNIYLKAL
jgi:Domain of Unknown Function (DUF1080)